VGEAGGRVLNGPVDAANAGRWVEFTDAEGAVLNLWQARDRKGAQLVNDTGSWNASDLHTADLPSARAFYGAMFGWEARPMVGGRDDAMMWCLPGYGDFLTTIDPGVRERHAAAGAPDGFTDAVGWLTKVSPGVPAPVHVPGWSVTFSVDDTDAAVERAQKLGADVVVAPYAAGPVRFAVLRDPQGAPFSVSRYVPPS
jgi:predicted enzyme related to lactoylglutathione lyase